MSCDICGARKDTTALRDIYATKEIAHVCTDCEALINRKLDDLRGLTVPLLHRFMDSLRRKKTKPGWRERWNRELRTGNHLDVPEGVPSALAKARELLEDAWGVIANAGHPGLGDWTGLSYVWASAAGSWRDRWLAFCRETLPQPSAEPLSGHAPPLPPVASPGQPAPAGESFVGTVMEGFARGMAARERARDELLDRANLLLLAVKSPPATLGKAIEEWHRDYLVRDYAKNGGKS